MRLSVVVCLVLFWGCDESESAGSSEEDAAPPVERVDGDIVCEPEVCDGVDNDCDGLADEGVKNVCGVCGADPVERCDGIDNDCDGEVDEGETNACGRCGALPPEVCGGGDEDCDGRFDEDVVGGCGCDDPEDESCNGADDDCDGQTDEGLTNGCGECGPVPEESCNQVDDDCDGHVDEGLTNACGLCGEVPTEVCNGHDDDCDGLTDEGVSNSCGGCGADPLEVCDSVDNDCDGLADEADGVEAGMRNACGECGPLPAEQCNFRDDDCDGVTDEGVRNACEGCGAVPVEVCNNEDDDCDGALDEHLPLNRCGNDCRREPVEVCNQFDDDCDGTVDEGLPTNACGVCGPLEEEACGGGDEDCDGVFDEGFRLNRCGACGPEPAEVCNGADDDCDGRADEDFEVGRSVENCGGCGVGCSEQNAVAACVSGRCLVVACEEDWRDANLDPDDGCEAPVPAAVLVYVNGAVEESGDGTTPETPFRTIAEGLAEAPEGARIIVAPAVYEEAVRIEVRDVLVDGRSQGVTLRRAGCGAEPVVEIAADGAVLRGVEVDGTCRQTGVHIACVGCGLEDSVVRDVGSDDADVFGVRVTRGEGVRLQRVTVEGVRGGTQRAFGVRFEDAGGTVAESTVERVAGLDAAEGAAGSTAVGVSLDGARGVTLTDVSVRGVLGGRGGAALAEAVGGVGGDGFGIRVESSRDVVLVGRGVDARGQRRGVYDVAGNNAGGWFGTQIGVPGAGVGLSVESSSAVRVEALVVDGVAGGAGDAVPYPDQPDSPRGSRGGFAVGLRLSNVAGLRVVDSVLNGLAGGAGALQADPGPSYGVEIRADNSDVLVDRSNLVEGMELFVADSPAGEAVVVAGMTLERDVVTTNLGRIVVIDAPGARIEGNVVSDLHTASGRGGVTTGNEAHAGDVATGIYVEGSAGVVVRDNRVARITGGTGGVGGHFGFAPSGGPAYGVWLTSCDRAVLEGNRIENISGGATGFGRNNLGGLGAAIGVYALRGDLTARNTFVSSLAGGSFPEQVGIYADGVGDVLIRGATIRDIPLGGRGRYSAGIYVNTIANEVRVSEVVFDRVFNAVSIYYDRIPEEAVHLDHLAVYRTPLAVRGEVEGLLELDESCLGEDHAPLPNGPCVDAGDPNRPCGDEPGGAACRLDLGHLSGTADASSRAP